MPFDPQPELPMISGESWDPKKAFIYGGWTVGAGIAAFLAGGVSSLVEWPGGRMFSIGRKSINIHKAVAQTFVSDIFGNPTGWLINLILEKLYG